MDIRNVFEGPCRHRSTVEVYVDAAAHPREVYVLHEQVHAAPCRIDNNLLCVLIVLMVHIIALISMELTMCSQYYDGMDWPSGMLRLISISWRSFK